MALMALMALMAHKAGRYSRIHLADECEGILVWFNTHMLGKLIPREETEPVWSALDDVKLREGLHLLQQATAGSFAAAGIPPDQVIDLKTRHIHE